MFRTLCLTSLLVLSTMSCRPVDDTSPADAFYARLQSLCGSVYEGVTVFPEDPGDDFRDQPLTARIQTCDGSPMRIPFEVGSNRSRTWLIRPVEAGLELKHDHRHADGSEDEITQYGGQTQTPGTAWEQSFAADAYTAELIPAAATNVWTLRLSEDGQTLVYSLTRHGKPRYEARLRRVSD